jgi:hypothetical protein
LAETYNRINACSSERFAGVSDHRPTPVTEASGSGR